MLILATAALVPAVSVRFIADRWLDRARDVWLLTLACVAAAVLLVREPALGCMAFAVLLHWRSEAQLPAVLTWAGISATWLLVQALPVAAQATIPWGWRALVIGHVAFALDQRWRRREVKSILGQRTMLAALLALVLPFSGPWEWPVYAAGLWLTSSWVAGLAVLAGLAVRYPETGPSLAALAGLTVLLWTWPAARRRILDATPRGSSLDGLWIRWATSRALVRLAWAQGTWWRGRGPGDRRALDRPRDDLQREYSRTGVPVLPSPCHCEPLELVYTYGVLGIAAMGALVWRLAPRLEAGDPWSACVVTGGVLALGTSPARVVPVGLVWLIALAVVAGR